MIFISIWLLPNLAIGGPDRATLLSMSCAACHGTDGKSPGAMPVYTANHPNTSKI
ncbi:MAG: hypothetical protein CM1200mP30_01620 [Pseudomonadota bacterium]|nr:MAG: hypothetical protein CM1200mP30_01620 [Pseudomonadota bacterium]